jgi:tetratricopeptide (TPR) repeat protein
VALASSPSRRHEKEEPAPEKPAVTTPKPLPKTEPPKPIPAPTPSNAELEEKMRREVAEAQKKTADEWKTAKEASDKKAAEEKATREAEEKAKKESADKAVREKKEGYETRKRERRAESVRKLEEAKKAVEEDRQSEAARQKAVTEKLKNARLSLRVKNGLKLDNVIVQALTRDEIKLAFQYEGADVEQSFPVDFIADRSYVDLMKAIHKGDGAAGLYEMGRRLVLRKLWKDAQAAFQECVKIDSSFAPRVPDIARILNNEAAFKGSARRIGPDQLVINWDFEDAAMAQDFTPRQPGQIACEAGELKLESKLTGLWTLKDVDFDHEVDADLTAVVDENAALVVGGFLTWDRKGYLAVLNNKTPPGHFLFQMEPQKPMQAVSSRTEPRLAPGTETRIRFQARSGSIRVYIGDQQILGASDLAHQKGWLVLGAAGGTARIKQMTVQGRVHPTEIDKRFAEVEVLVRRAFEEGLGKKARKTEGEVDPLSAEDEFYLSRVPATVRADFDKARAALVQALHKRQLTPPVVQAMEAVIQKAPDCAAALFWRGVIRMAARRPEEARADFESALKQAPDFHEANQLLARSLLDDQEVAAAQAEVRKVLELMPGEADALALAGQIRYLTGDPKGALADLEVARKIDPTSDYCTQTQRSVQNVIKGPPHLGAKYLKEFPHFTVMTDMSGEKTTLYGNRMEAAYRHWAEVFKDHFVEDPRRLKPRVAIFNTREAFLTYGEMTLSGRQEWTLGYFHPLYNELLLFEDVDIDATLHVLYHETFHQFLRTMVRRPPYWYNEGMAEFMGGLRVEVPKTGPPKIAERARILEGRLKAMKMGIPFALKFEDIMMQSPAQFYSGPVALKYAQAWTMIHFFYEGAGGKHRPRIDSYFRKLKDGGTAREALQAGFGDARLEDLQKEWLEYVKKMEPPKPEPPKK